MSYPKKQKNRSKQATQRVEKKAAFCAAPSIKIVKY